MEKIIEKLVSYEDFIENTEKIMLKLDLLGEIIIIKNNIPAYRMVSVNMADDEDLKNKTSEMPNEIKDIGNKEDVIQSGREFFGLTLKMAVIEVLKASNEEKMHVSKIADKIYDRRLYRKKDGGKAHYTQIRAMCGQYPEEFETLPGNVIKMKKQLEKQNIVQDRV